MIQRILSALLAFVFIALTFVFASLLVALGLTAGAIAWGWLWWRGRKARRQVIEGEYRIIETR
jgi:hypothetical protein